MDRPGAPIAMETASRYRWAILGLAFVSQFNATLAAQTVPPLAPIFQSELGLTKLEIGFFSSAAFVGSWMVLLGAGYLTERFGVRRIMSLGQLVAGSVMLTMSIAGTFLEAVFVMFVVGLCRGLVHPGASKSVMDWFPARERATAMGVKQSGYPIAGILLGATLPALALAVGWRHAIALVGLIIISGGIITVITYRDPNREVTAARREASMREGLSVLLRNRRLWAISCTALLLVSAQLALVAYLALYFSDIILVQLFPDTGVRIIAAGGFLALLQVGGVVGRVGWGMVSDRFLRERRLPLMATTGAISGSMALVMAFLTPGVPFWLLAMLVFVYGASALGWNGLYQALIVETSGQKHAAMAVGLCMTMTQMGTISGPPLFGLIVDQAGTYQSAWLCLTGLSLGGALLATFFSRRELGVPGTQVATSSK